MNDKDTYNECKVKLIVAICKGGGIGINNKIPWKISDDLIQIFWIVALLLFLLQLRKHILKYILYRKTFLELVFLDQTKHFAYLSRRKGFVETVVNHFHSSRTFQYL